MAGVEVVKAGKDEFQTDWAAAVDVSVPQAEVADVSELLSLHVVSDTFYSIMHMFAMLLV